MLPRLLHALGATVRGSAPGLTPEAVSRTIGLARITLIIGLVFLHYQSFPNSQVSPFDGMDPQRHQVATFVNSFVLFFFCSAVPLLSMISGWLFFAWEPGLALPALRTRIARRVESLYMPLVLWNGVFLLVLWAVFVAAPGHPLLTQLNISFADASLLDYLNAVFAVTGHPVGFQFWFLRDLFVAVLASPLLWLLLRYAPYVGMLALGAAWMIGHELWVFFRADVVLFFYLGGFMRMYKVPLELGRKTVAVALLLYIALVALRAGAPLVLDLEQGRPVLLTAATRAMRLLGVVACWGLLLQLSATRLGVRIARLGGLAFFVYALHFPLIAQIKLMLWPLLPAQSDGWMLAHYAITVAVTALMTISAALVLNQVAPRLFSVLNGGRSGLAQPARTHPASHSLPLGS